MTRPGKITVLFWMLLLTGSLLGQAKSPDPNFHKPLQVHEHEYAPLREAGFELLDFTLPTVEGKMLRLGDLARGKKLVLVHFFATFCHNSNYDVVTINELYRQYQDQGLAVIGVCEYSSADQLKEFMARHQPLYPIVMEGEGRRGDRLKTRHYRYRTMIGDTRGWGTPFNVVIEGEEIEPEGEVLARRLRIATGELIKTEMESLIRRKIKPVR